MSTAPRNTLALVSFLLSLVLPIAIVVNLIATFAAYVAKQPSPLLGGIQVTGTVLGVVGLPAMIAAIVTGHIALGRAKRFPPQQAGRGLAIAGLVIGYASIALSLLLVVAVFAYIALTLR
jgi:hypothetical protein